MVSCDTKPTSDRSRPPALLMSAPATLTLPRVGDATPAITLRSVVFPAALPPMIATYDPDRMRRSTSDSAA